MPLWLGFLILWAAVSLRAADTYRNAAPGVPYAGSRACASCHADIYGNYTRSSMGRSMSAAGSDLAAKVPTPVGVAHPRWNRRFRVYREGGSVFQSFAEPGPGAKDLFRAAFRLEFVVGSGANGWSYLVRRDQHLFEAPLSYYSRAARWDLSPGYESADVGFNRAILPSCLACHTGRPNPGSNDQGRYADSPFAELAIGCENCHGPGSLHVAQSGRVASPEGRLIVNPARLAPRLAEDICLRCHQDGDARVLQPGKNYWDFRPGDWLIRTLAVLKVAPRAGETAPESDLLEHHFAMRQSLCFRASRGELSCFTCHRIHQPPPAMERAAYYRSRCLTCHTPESCKLPRAERLQRDAADSCIACHMPGRDVTTIAHSTLTQHRIARPGAPAPPPTAPDGDPAGLLLVNRPAGPAAAAIAPVALLQAYRQLLDRRPDFRPLHAALLDQLSRSTPDHPDVQAALGRRALAPSTPEFLAPALRHLARAVELGATDPEIYHDLAQAQARTGRPADAVQTLERGLAQAPFSALLHKALALLCIRQNEPARARERLRLYLDLFPEDTRTRDLLAELDAGLTTR